MIHKLLSSHVRKNDISRSKFMSENIPASFDGSNIGQQKDVMSSSILQHSMKNSVGTASAICEPFRFAKMFM